MVFKMFDDFNKLMAEVNGTDVSKPKTTYLLKGYDPFINQIVLRFALSVEQYETLLNFTSKSNINFTPSDDKGIKLDVNAISQISAVQVPEEIKHIDWYLEKTSTPG